MLAIMADCSRNAVMTVKTGKTFIDNMALMGYDTLMLYTEDTYEVPGEPYFGYLRGRFSQDELRELVAYGEEKGIELIPCIQTLGHLNAIFRWPEYQPINDTADILLVEEPRTMTLIENMLKSLRSCFKTDKIHIGMDESPTIGLGKYLDKHGFQQRHEIFCRHLTEVCKLCKKYGFSPMIWGDMFFKLSCHGEYYADIPQEQFDWIKSMVPEDVRLVYWNYYTHTETHEAEVVFEKKMLEQHRRLSSKEPLFAGGVWTWEGPVPQCEKAMKVTKASIQACREAGVKDVLITAWMDGGECSFISALPLYFYAAETYRGNTDLELIKSRYKELFHMDFDDACSLTDLEKVQKEGKFLYVVSKLYLHNDILLGVADNYAPEHAEEAYGALAKKYAALAEKEEMNDLWKLEFRHAAALAELLSVKTCLGAKLRSAYQSDDRAALQKLADNDLPLAIEKAESYFEAVRKLWFAEKKAFGFEVQEMRLSYIVTRLRSTLARLKDYLDGGAGIEELEQTILDTKFHAARWNRLATPNVIFLNF